MTLLQDCEQVCDRVPEYDRNLLGHSKRARLSEIYLAT